MNKLKTGKRKASVLALLLSTMLLSGCAQENTSVDIIAEDNTVKNESNGTMSPSANDGEEREIPVCTLDTNDMFSDRDREVGYDEGADTMITLHGSTASCESKAVLIADNRVTITDEGTYIISGTLDNGSIVVDAEKTDKVQLVLNGVDIACNSSAAIYVKQADKVLVTLASGTTNSLETSGEFVAIDDNNIDAVFFSKDDLTLNGSGSLTLQCATGHGIVSKDDLVFIGGNYEMHVSNHGLSGKNSVRIGGGSFCINAGEDGIHSENDDDTSLGFVYIADGTLSIAVEDDGIHAGNQVLIDGGTVNIMQSEEGIEGLTVDIAGGDITVNANDDGLNATDGSGSENEMEGRAPADPFEATDNAYIKISGGTLKVKAYGDGIDSNGALYVTGGITYVSGPENNGNGSVDYASVGQITGGIFVAAGSGGMAQNFSDSLHQGSMLVKLNSTQSIDSEITLHDEKGNMLVSFVPETKYTCVIISCPEIQKGNTYTLAAGTESTDIEMTSLIYGSGMMDGFGGGMGGQRPGGHGGMNGGMGGRTDGMKGERPQGIVPDMEQGTRPENMPEGGFDGEMPQMPKGGFGGEMPQMPEGGFDGEMPQMPEGGLDEEIPQM